MRYYHSVEEVRAALYPRMARLLALPPDALIVWPHWHYDKRGWHPCTDDHSIGKRRNT